MGASLELGDAATLLGGHSGLASASRLSGPTMAAFETSCSKWVSQTRTTKVSDSSITDTTCFPVDLDLHEALPLEIVYHGLPLLEVLGRSLTSQRFISHRSASSEFGSRDPG